MTRSNYMKKRSAALTLLGSVALIISIAASSDIVDAKPGATSHESDISHPEGTSPWPKYSERLDTNTSEVPKLPESIGDASECPKKDVPKSSCWRTYTGCYAPDDIIECPNKHDGGLTSDDGLLPGVTEDLLDLLQEKNITSTFFVMDMKSTKGYWP